MRCSICHDESDELTNIEMLRVPDIELCNLCRSEILRELMSQFILEMWMEKP